MPLTFERRAPFRVLGRWMHCPLRRDVELDRTSRTGAGAGGVFVIHIVSLIPLDACRISRVRKHESLELLIEIPTKFSVKTVRFQTSFSSVKNMCQFFSSSCFLELRAKYLSFNISLTMGTCGADVHDAFYYNRLATRAQRVRRVRGLGYVGDSGCKMVEHFTETIVIQLGYVSKNQY